jgi:hypothetical protein
MKTLSIRMRKIEMTKDTTSGNRTYKSFVKQFKHDTRHEKMDSTYLQRKENSNKHYLFNDKLFSENIDKETMLKEIAETSKDWEYIKADFKEEHKKNLHKQTKPVLNFLLSFSKDFDLNEEDRVKQFKVVKQYIQEHFDYAISLHQHNDEKALHYSFNVLNFDKKTKRPIAKQIDTSKLQDQIANYLTKYNANYGHSRGEKKTVSLAKHRTIMEAKVQQLQEKEKELQEKNKQIEDLNYSLEKKNKQIEKMVQENLDNLNTVENQYIEEIENIIADLIEFKTAQDVESFLKKVARAIKNDKDNRIEKLINKWQKGLEIVKERKVKNINKINNTTSRLRR